MNRRNFLVAAAGAAPVLLARGAPERSLVLLTAADAQRIRNALDTKSRVAIEQLADEAQKAGPWSVTYHRPEGGLTGAGLHDYFSEGPYWWRDPKNPNGPYIRRDGESNPARFMGNRNDIGRLSECLLALGLGAFLLNEPRYAGHAESVARVWFVDTATRMNPNLDHGQAVRGVNDGRGTGLIDTVALIHCVQGLALAEEAGGIDPEVMRGARAWFADFVQWMMSSAKGLDEKKSGNNHATWWAAQVAAYSSFLDRQATLETVFDDYRSYLVPAEIRPNGSCPREEARTNSLGYSCFNLDAFSVLCRIAQVHGTDLWHFESPDGVSLAKACDYLLPFLLRPESWKHQQISPFKPDGVVFPGLAGIGMPSRPLLDAYRQLPHSKGPWNMLIEAIVR